jgi:RNA polymerase sigma-70 factor (ECF subfamily)
MAVSATVSNPEVPSDPASPATLGAVLYAGSTQPIVPETVWVDLVRAVAAGDQIAFQALYTRTHRLVFTLSMRIVASRETAEELTLDVFHDIWRRAAAYDENGGTVLGWIMNQARSRAIDRQRFEHRKKRVAAHSEEVDVEEPVDVSSEQLIASRQQGRQLRHAMAALTANEREAIEIAFFADCTYAEVAQRLQQPPGTIKTRIRSGLAKLRAALAEEGQS